MTRRKGLVLDANILLRAVLGQRVLELLEAFEDTVAFYSPDVCFDDARKYIPDVSSRRRIDPLPGLAVSEGVVTCDTPSRRRRRRAPSTQGQRAGRKSLSGGCARCRRGLQLMHP